jgi:hypothetical protein
MDYNKFKAPASVVRQNPLGLRRPVSPRVVQWMDIVRFLEGEECVGIRKKLCVSCGFGKLYDKQGKEIKISKYFTLEKVKEIVNMIKAQD